MIAEKLPPNRGTNLRQNLARKLIITIDESELENIFLINGNRFLTTNIGKDDLDVEPDKCYMIINKGPSELEVHYSQDVSSHKVVYNPYKYENTEKEKFNPETFKEEHDVPEGYVDTLPKWYSIKYTYPDYNLIYIKPEMGISIQKHSQRSEYWTILDGNPIVINDHRVHYDVENNAEFINDVGTYHTVINPNKKEGAFIVLKEKYKGHFEEEDITRVFNPNHYE